ncbi:outer membrane beta-barrel protein [Lacinutrix jangbogonensis]|uniref:outer membrane beta-barrel protein n=1 Tax=Lacinutrix jangbogonensis TaxID=1469557 RepID=UPI00053E497D|nr:outer membrane beta-barrel protein [Lacinutrix jangbogonensis]
MSEKKHIDRLFQEKLKDFEAKPSANVWAGIQSKMEKPQEKTKTIFPFGLRLVGIAAALVLLFAVGNIAFNNENTESNTTTVADTNNNTESSDTDAVDTNSNAENKNSSTISNTDDANTTGVVFTEDKDTSKENNYSVNNKNESIENTAIVSNENNSKSNTTVSKTLQNKVNPLSSQVSNTKDASEKDNVNANASVVNRNNIPNSKINGVTVNSEKENVLNTANNSPLYAQSNSVAKLNTTVSNSNNSDTAVTNNNNVPNNLVLSNSNTTKNTAANANSTINNSTTNNDSNTSTTGNSNTTLNKPNTKATGVLDNNSATSNTIVATTDSEKEKEEVKMMEPDSANSSNTIEEALAKTNDLDEEEENVNRWSVNANAGPVYYNTLGKGSHIHDQFIDNPKNGEINTSYGINVGYALNDRLKVRTGINKLNLSYDTANVIVYENVTSTPSGSPLRNIDFVPTSQGQNISVLSSNSLSVQQIDGFINDDLNAALSQRLSYLEVPLELEYAVVKKRFGINLIGGFSTFVLSDNEVVTEVDNRKTKIGEANNINTVSFSANAGIGIDYKFNKSLKFNLEPTFKYQINAYSETSGDFRPYIIGVYTGISYKF